MGIYPLSVSCLEFIMFYPCTKGLDFFFPINFCSIFAVKMQNVLSFVLQHPVLDRLKDLNWFVLLLCR